MQLRWQHLLLLTSCSLFSACGESPSIADPEMVFGNLGLICIGPDVEARGPKLMDSINKAATREGLTRVTMNASGSSELSRAAYEFEDGQGNTVRLDFVDREALDLRVLVTANGDLRERFVDAIWDEFVTQIN
ncbi:MAG: hypothetical protein AAGG38_04895 [Planctomycetota bacterium]